MVIALWLNDRQVDRLSEMVGNMGLLFIASFTIPAFLSEKPASVVMALSGTVLAIFCLCASIVLLRGGEEIHE